jgi:hypothetical protein
MSTPQISLTPNAGPMGPIGWLGRMMAGLGVLVVITAGIAISPAATNAGHDWSHADERAAPEPAALAERPGLDRPHESMTTVQRSNVGPDIVQVAHPLSRDLSRPGSGSPMDGSTASPTDRVDAPRFEPVAARPTASRPGLGLQMLGHLLERATAEFERLRDVVVTASAD